MERYLMFIRDVGKKDHADIHPREPDARLTLADCVRQRSGKNDAIAGLGDNETVDTYLARETAVYVIGCVSKPATSDGIPS
ncbi:MAG: hypothetical protein EOO77_25080 [Oxalobacteraceae bacterium]|nr:MAG: hypothetical protein EOO77_25080 [Oxalobacteraceae bacterium]